MLGSDFLTRIQYPVHTSVFNDISKRFLVEVMGTSLVYYLLIQVFYSSATLELYSLELLEDQKRS